MKKIQIISSVEKGTLKRNRSLIDEALAAFEGKTIRLTIERATKTRSNQQNAYYWGVVLPILCAHFEGYTKDEMHDAMKIKFLSLHEDNPEKLQTIRSTAKLNTDEFKAYIEQIQRWAAEFAGVDIPDPGEGTFDDRE